MIVQVEVFDKIVAHGVSCAKKWAEYENDKEMWEQRYFALQRLYADLSDSATAYSDFNKRCDVVVKGGHVFRVFGWYK